MSNNRLFLLNESKNLAMEGRYKEALEMVNQLLLTISDDLDGLRLKGNILDLEVSVENIEFPEHERKAKLAMAQKCYERILELDPNNVLALIDLGDYWQNRTYFKQSLDYYNQALNLLKNNHFYLSLEDEFIEAFMGKKEVLQKMNKEPELNICQKEEKAILSRLPR
jgi:tetratricopeptide (TPR) repeat protein